jgi:hypothetical protein
MEMIKNCPVCGKAFEVLYPDLWRYKRDMTLLCTWGCMRALDDKKGVNRDMALTKAQKQAVIEMLLNGENPNEFIKNCGIKNPTCTVWNLKQYLKKYDRETWEKLQPKPAAPAVEIPEAPVKAEIPERPAPVQVPEKPKLIEYRVTGISTEAGDFQYYRKQGFLDWTTLDGTAVSMSLAEWAELMRVFPEVVRVLGVDL